MKQHRSTIWSVALLCGFFLQSAGVAQEEQITGSSTEQQESDRRKTGPRTVPCFEAIDRASSKQLEDKEFANLPGFARFWLTEDVVDLISPEERCTFLQLATDEERSQFIEQFWSRRAPDPTLLDNSFKQAHYERIAFADEKYGTQMPGWKTDRGRVYVTFGRRDSIESHRAGEKTGRPPEDGVESYQYSFEVWRYRHLEGVGEHVELEFVNPSESGDYHLAMPAEMKDELIFAPRYNLGRSSRVGVTAESAQSFELFIGPAPTPLVQFKDLEAMVVSRIVRDQVRFSYQIEFAKATNATTLARILVYLPSDNRVLRAMTGTRRRGSRFSAASVSRRDGSSRPLSARFLSMGHAIPRRISLTLNSMPLSFRELIGLRLRLRTWSPERRAHCIPRFASLLMKK